MTANTTADDLTSKDVEAAERQRAQIHKYARMDDKTRLAERSCEGYTGVPTLDVESDDGNDDTSDEPTETATCSNCGHEGPRDTDADARAVVWFEDSWTCQKCKFKARKSSRSSRRGGMGSGGLGR